MIRVSAIKIIIFLLQMPVESSPSRNGQDGVKTITVTVEIVAMFHFGKYQNQKTVTKELS